MVDAIVSFAVKRLDDFLIQEAVFLRGVKNKVQRLKNELGYMRSFLKDAEEKQDANNSIRTWVTDVRDIAYEAEDIIDTFILTKGKGNDHEVGTSKGGRFTSVKKFICCGTKPSPYEIGKQIESLRKRIDDVKRMRENYSIADIGSVKEGTSGAISRWRQLRRTTSYADEDHVVGLEDDARFLEGKILQEEKWRTVISIFGMGGLGKTTLARKLYNSDNIKLRFDFHAWVCVSQEWRIRDLLETIIKSHKNISKDELESLEKMSEGDMERYLRKLLKSRRYLVVIDDIWSTEAWESLVRALPKNKKASRVIITTRIQAVAELSDEKTHVHKLRFLRPKESWKLFCKKAFPEHDEADDKSYGCPPDLKKLGEEIVVKCDGQPLAIIVLGGLLSRREPHEWRAVRDHLWRELRKGSIHIPLLLALSYKDLPPQLKLCFLYTGLFSEDFVINANTLMLMWIAEGFVSQEEGLDLEEVAEEYLKELTGRSLIQVVERNWRTIATCRVHDLLRDLAIAKAKELNLLHVYDRNMNSTGLPTTFRYQRLTASHANFKSVLCNDRNEKVRSLLFLNSELEVPVEKFKLITARFKLLRTLDLEGLRFCPTKNKVELPHTIGELIHLKYLGLVNTKIKILPATIGKLQALETIEASSDVITSLPREIRKLKRLRHLKGRFNDAALWSSNNSKDLVFPNLQTLQIVIIENLKKWKLASKRFTKLKYLSLLSENGKLSMQPLLDCRHLIELRMDAEIGGIPDKMHNFLPKLRYLELRNSKLERDPMPTLEKFQELMVLVLNHIEVENLTISAQGFPQLQVLMVYKFRKLLEVKVEEGAMVRLKALTIDSARRKQIPEKLRSLPSVAQLNWKWDAEMECAFRMARRLLNPRQS